MHGADNVGKAPRLAALGGSSNKHRMSKMGCSFRQIDRASDCHEAAVERAWSASRGCSASRAYRASRAGAASPAASDGAEPTPARRPTRLATGRFDGHGSGRTGAWRRLVVLLAASVFALLGSTAAFGIVSSNVDPIFNGVNINALVGAEQFYLNGYWGQRVVIANVEAGHVWNGHMTLGHVADFINHSSIAATPPNYDVHATAVGHVLVGRSDLNVALGPGITITIPAPDSYFYLASDSEGRNYNWSAFTGLAPMATFWSSALATGFSSDGSFSTTNTTIRYAYDTVMRPSAYQSGRVAHVVNSSWGFSDPGGSGYTSRLVDGLGYAFGTTVVVAAGNHLGAMQQVTGPASGYNSIAVAALASDTSTPAYGAVAGFSNAGPNDFYNPKTKTTIGGVRAAVDLAAPGSNLTLAYYGGTTGSNSGGTDITAGSPYYFLVDAAGTSFASPIVAGGAALLVDVGLDIYAGNAAAVDGRVIKAVLLNSAAKTDGWDNGQSVSSGVVVTTQSLDHTVGAGMLDLQKAYNQYTTGTSDVPGLGGGIVASTGWDYGQVSEGSPNWYNLGSAKAGKRLTATLAWFVNRSYTPFQLDVQFANLDLEVWTLDGAGSPASLIAESRSIYNNVEHLQFDLPETSDYALRVLWAGEVYDMSTTANSEWYGLAWRIESPIPVPEPAVAWLAAAALSVILVRFRHRRHAGRSGR